MTSEARASGLSGAEVTATVVAPSGGLPGGSGDAPTMVHRPVVEDEFPDPYGAPVLYAYLTVRDPKAPGGARFVPEQINNASGAGSQVAAVDMNKDGIVDVLTTGANGSFIFFGKARPGMKRGTATAGRR